jgi:HPt (histidine-containing phosphotransfer) domain-containing protein
MNEPFFNDDWQALLRPRFQALTAQRLSELKLEQLAFRSGEYPAQVFDRIGNIAHKIYGTADSFGYRQLGMLARQVEEGCRLEELANDSHASEQLIRIGHLIDALIEEIIVVLNE